MSSLLQKVYCVIDTRECLRVSQFYARKGDAIRKADKLSHGCFLYFKVMEYNLENPVEVK